MIIEPHFVISITLIPYYDYLFVFNIWYG